MKSITEIPTSKKLHVLYRLEAGCLGPDGVNYIEAFCENVQAKVEQVDSGFICWQIVPRHDKALPEIEYAINQKKLSNEQTDAYLNVFDKNLASFEDELNELLGHAIEEYFDR